jgi:arsenical pump membrane protein
MSEVLFEVVAAIVLMALLAVVVLKPRGLPEGFVGLLGAAILIVIGATTPSVAFAQAESLMPTVLFLGFCLIFAGLCEREGLFVYCADIIGRLSRGRPGKLFVLCFLMAAFVTASLSLDTTVLLLTPVILATAERMRLDYRPYAYAACHLANTASLLLPVSNLTNLLAMQNTGLDFLDFVVMMALPWLAAVGTEFAVLRCGFGTMLSSTHYDASDSGRLQTTGNRSADDNAPKDDEHVPLLAIVVVGMTLAGFMISGKLGLSPFWFAAFGCIALTIGRAAAGRASAREQLLQAWNDANPSFLLFVLALAVVVAALSGNGLGNLIAPLFSMGTSLPVLLLVAGVAALSANVLNNLTAAMLLIPLAASHGLIMVMAILIGVNIGPNLTYAGSLATILWRRTLQERGRRVELARFTAIGLISVPLCIIAATVTLWLLA